MINDEKLLVVEKGMLLFSNLLPLQFVDRPNKVLKKKNDN